MPSERTFFNKAVYKRALSRFWIIGAAYAVVLCFLTLMCGQYFNSEFTEVSEYVSYSILSNLTRREILAAAAAAVVMAVAVYGWMVRKTSAAYISALPVTREALLISSLLAGLTLPHLPCITGDARELAALRRRGSPCNPVPSVLGGSSGADEHSVLRSRVVLHGVHRKRGGAPGRSTLSRSTVLSGSRSGSGI